MMHVVDMLPTIAATVGASTNGTKPLDGMNVWDTIAKNAPSPRNEIVYNVEMFRGGVREGDMKLVWQTPLPQSIELFDIAKDPGETKNLAAEQPATVEKLQARIQQLAGEMAKSQFMQATMKAYLGREHGTPMFPNEPGFFDQVPD
jgi:arylsulfatase A-like enzyme